MLHEKLHDTSAFVGEVWLECSELGLSNGSFSSKFIYFEIHFLLGLPLSFSTTSNHGDAESTLSGDKFTDEPSWGAAFDTNYDVDSVWGFSPKDAGHERTTKNSFFGSEDFGTNHIRVDSPSASSVFGQDRKSPFFDSVPSTPHFKSNSSPRFSEGPEDHTYDDFSGLDSYSMHDSRFSPQREGHARFDSISSVNDFDRSRGFSFDDTDPFSIGPFRSLDNPSPRKNSDNWSSF